MQQEQYQRQLPAPFRITMLQFLETGTYNDIYHRPYKTHVTRDTMGAFQEATMGGQNINVNTVAGVAGEILRPAGEVEKDPITGLPMAVKMPNGWGERRFLFMLEVHYPMGDFTSSSGVRQIIGGYTNYVGASNLTGANVRLDPNMEMYINSVTTIRSVEMNGPMGRYLQDTVIDDSQILNGEYQVSAGGFGDMEHVARAMRPQDVFQASQIGVFQDAPTYDSRTNFAYGIKKSRRSNNLAPSYISKVATAWQHSLNQASDVDNDQAISSRAAGLVAEPTLVKDRFMKMLGDGTQVNHRGFVTYGELCRMQADLDRIADVRYQDKRSIVQAHERGQTEHWHGAGLVSVLASILFQAVPAVMVSLMLTRITIMATNRTMNGEFDIRPTELHGFQQMPVDDARFNLFANRLRTEVLRDLSRNNLIDMAFTLTVDITNESMLSISIDGKPPVPFVVPSFSDGRFVPVLTNQYSTLEHMAADVSSLCQNVATDFGRNMLNPQQQSGLMQSFGSQTPDAPPGADNSRLIVTSTSNRNHMNEV